VDNKGTRNDLLQADGAYACRVQAQKLREVAKGSDGAVGDQRTMKNGGKNGEDRS
jgi:hypothetical protein